MANPIARILTAFCLAALGPSAGVTQATSYPLDALVDSLRIVIDKAVSRDDLEALRNARTFMASVLRSHPADGLLLHYQGYVLHREAQLLRQLRRADEADRAREESKAILERSVKLRPLPETHALLALIIGQQMAGNPVRAVLLGGRWSEEMDRALKLGGNNPRVLLMRGINALHAPRMFGGGVERAQEYLEQSVAVFGRTTPAALLPAWGHAEAYAWLGRVHERRGDHDRAERAYTHALELDPDFSWVSRVLLPGLRNRRQPSGPGA